MEHQNSKDNDSSSFPMDKKDEQLETDKQIKTKNPEMPEAQQSTEKSDEGITYPENAGLEIDSTSASTMDTSEEEDLGEITQEESESESVDEDVPELSLTDLRNRIGMIESEVKIWRTKREELNNQVIEKAKIRNELNTKVRELITMANEERHLRDEANTEINALKEEKKKLQTTIEQYQEDLEKTDIEIEKSGPAPTNKSIKKLEQDIKSLEWKLQTTSNLSLEEEREVVDRISTLEDQLINLQEFKELSDEKREKRFSLRRHRQQLRKTISTMNKRAKDSRAHHTKMIEGYHQANSLRKEADNTHAEIQRIKQEADTVHQEYVNKIKEKRKLSDALRKIQRRERDQQAAVAKEKLKEKTEKADKLAKEGKKISFEDFKALINRGLI